MEEKPTEEKPTNPTLAEAPQDDPISYEDFAKIKLGIGHVKAAARHPKADRLLVLEVEVGEARPRTIVAGIADRYAPEELVGQQIVVVLNLKPAKLRGILSEGMLLAAGGEGVKGLLTVPAPVPPGSGVR
jgi:methionyl-tRNA synthetase